VVVVYTRAVGRSNNTEEEAEPTEAAAVAAAVVVVVISLARTNPKNILKRPPRTTNGRHSGRQMLVSQRKEMIPTTLDHRQLQQEAEAIVAITGHSHNAQEEPEVAVAGPRQLITQTPNKQKVKRTS